MFLAFIRPPVAANRPINLHSETRRVIADLAAFGEVGGGNARLIASSRRTRRLFAAGCPSITATGVLASAASFNIKASRKWGCEATKQTGCRRRSHYWERRNVAAATLHPSACRVGRGSDPIMLSHTHGSDERCCSGPAPPETRRSHTHTHTHRSAAWFQPGGKLFPISVYTASSR